MNDLVTVASTCAGVYQDIEVDAKEDHEDVGEMFEWLELDECREEVEEVAFAGAFRESECPYTELLYCPNPARLAMDSIRIIACRPGQYQDAGDCETRYLEMWRGLYAEGCRLGIPK